MLCCTVQLSFETERDGQELQSPSDRRNPVYRCMGPSGVMHCQTLALRHRIAPRLHTMHPSNHQAPYRALATAHRQSWKPVHRCSKFQKGRRALVPKLAPRLQKVAKALRTRHWTHPQRTSASTSSSPLRQPPRLHISHVTPAPCAHVHLSFTLFAPSPVSFFDPLARILSSVGQKLWLTLFVPSFSHHLVCRR